MGGECRRGLAWGGATCVRMCVVLAGGGCAGERAGSIVVGSVLAHSVGISHAAR